MLKIIKSQTPKGTCKEKKQLKELMQKRLEVICISKLRKMTKKVLLRGL